MNKQQTNQMSSIRKKLMAAVAMLLVACIMTVSSTYAWFTLSTAPEVKGITTTVGANGNLEMALGTYDTFYGTVNPTANVGDSIATNTNGVTGANVTWGNLVDLSDASYGLSAIKLYPSRLNANGSSLNLLNPLQYPQYGSDGRITELNDGTMVGYYDAETRGFMALTTPNYAGVNGIGSASSMSEREFAVRNNKAAIESNRVAAMNAAKSAIYDYAGTLAGIAINYQDAAADAVVKEADITVLRNLIVKLQESNNYVSESLKAAVMLFLSSTQVTLSDDAWSGAISAATDKDIDAYITYLQDTAKISTLPTNVQTWVTEYNTIKSTLSTAASKLPASGDGKWEDIEESVGDLLNASGILIAGETISDIQSTKGQDTGAFKNVTDAVMAGNLSFTFTASSGIFADIAKMTGAYSSTMIFPEGTKVEGIDLHSLGYKKVDVESPSDNKVSGELGSIGVVMKDYAAPDAASDAAKALTDTYGYTVDMLFRTNASDSYLELQTDAVNRVYSEGGATATQGGGSNMTFTINQNYTKEKIEALAEGIRVVFYNAATIGTNSATIVAVATLDYENGVAIGDAYKMNLKLVDYTIDANGTITTNEFKSADDATTVQDERAALLPLTANVKTALSALVYLDGDEIDNSDAGISGDLNGVLNLQFSSSATLKPMDNNDLKNLVEESTAANP